MPAAARVPSIGELRRAPRRLPFTLCVVGLMAVLGVVTGALWTPVDTSEWWGRLAYGLPALQDGRWWTPVTGSLLATVPAQYLPVAGGFLLLVGLTELRLGTRWAALVAVGGQLAGVLGAAGLLAVLSRTGWSWAVELSTALDVGFSAGAVCAVTVVAHVLPRPWGGVVLGAVLWYCVVNLLVVGVLWDVEHGVAVVLGLVLGRRLAASRPAPPPLAPEAAARGRRWLGAAVLAAITSAQLLAHLLPDSGPLGGSGDPLPGVALAAALVAQVLVAAALGLGLPGARVAGVATAAFGAGVSVVVSPPPRGIAALLAYAVLAALLLHSREAWSLRALGRRRGH